MSPLSQPNCLNIKMSDCLLMSESDWNHTSKYLTVGKINHFGGPPIFDNSKNPLLDIIKGKKERQHTIPEKSLLALYVFYSRVYIEGPNFSFFLFLLYSKHIINQGLKHMLLSITLKFSSFIQTLESACLLR